jgi:ferric-dicitrate binding protein FerR (iron transport regulator)
VALQQADKVYEEEEAAWQVTEPEWKRVQPKDKELKKYRTRDGRKRDIVGKAVVLTGLTMALLMNWPSECPTCPWINQLAESKVAPLELVSILKPVPFLYHIVSWTVPKHSRSEFREWD